MSGLFSKLFGKAETVVAEVEAEAAAPAVAHLEHLTREQLLAIVQHVEAELDTLIKLTPSHLDDMAWAVIRKYLITDALTVSLVNGIANRLGIPSEPPAIVPMPAIVEPTPPTAA